MNQRWYILDDQKNLVPCDMDTWARWFETANRHVALSTGPDPKDQNEIIKVSTVILGLDHNFFDEGPPLVFETMIFGGEHDQYQMRTSSWAEAKAEHLKACKLADIDPEEGDK